MKNTTPEMKQRSTMSNLFASFIPALVSLPLCVAAGCVADDAATATKTQALGAGCTLYRPLGWAGAGAYCAEAQYNAGTVNMADGDSVFAVAADYPGMGYGEVTMFCHDGSLEPDPQDDFCLPQGGNGGDDR